MPAALPIPNCVECCPHVCTTSTTPVATVIEVINVDTVAEMAATTPYAGLRQFNVRGWITSNDGMGGLWVYDPASTQTADGYYVVDPGGSGRYLKNI